MILLGASSATPACYRRRVATAGYSGTPLARKLGLKEESLVALIDAPAAFAASLDLPPGARVVTAVGRQTLDVIVLFVHHRRELERAFPKLSERLAPTGAIWVAWPKLAARKKLGIDSDVTEDVIRAVVLPTGFVDVKVCAIDDVWSGLRCVLRRDRR